MDDRGAAQQLIETLLPERLARLRKSTGIPIVLGGVTRYGTEGVQLSVDRLMGSVGDALRGLVVQPGKGLGGYVLRRRTPLRVADYATTTTITHDYDHLVVQAERLTSMFAVPVLVSGEVRGVLFGAVRGVHPIGDRTVRTAVVVAEQLRDDVEQRIHRGADAPVHSSHGVIGELAAVIRDTSDPALRARLVRIRQDLCGRTAPVAPKRPLAPREIDVLRLVEVGSTNIEIAARLGLSLETIKAYLRSAMRKLEVHNRTAAAHRARSNGML